jgi:hypothetical protein
MSDMLYKIFWFGFKRNLIELYYLLYSEKFISCDINEFLSHFTGKKFRVDEKSSGRIVWKSEKYLLALVLYHLTGKGFLQKTFDDEGITLLKEHFEDFSQTDIEIYEKLKNNSESKSLQQKLDCLFPETSGLRCKTRLYYKERNRQSISAVLGNCGINIKAYE